MATSGADDLHILHSALEATLGRGPAATLMDRLAPAWTDLATRSDLALTTETLRREMADLRMDLRTEMADLRTDLRTEMADLRTAMADLRTELKTEMADRFEQQTRTLTLALVGSLATMTSLTLAAVALVG